MKEKCRLKREMKFEERDFIELIIDDNVMTKKIV